MGKKELLEQKQAEVEILKYEISLEKYKAVNERLNEIAAIFKTGQFFKIGDGTFVDVNSIHIEYKTIKLNCHGHISIDTNENFSIRVDKEDKFDLGCYGRNDNHYSISVYENDIDDFEKVVPISKADFLRAKQNLSTARKILLEIIS